MTPGKRIEPDENGGFNLQEGEYCLTPYGVWYGRPPGTNLIANLAKHTVTEHEDGTITVMPSILVRNHTGSWHGFLDRGAWKEC